MAQEWETPKEEAARLREEIEALLYQYAEALGYDASHYPFTDFKKLMDDMESQERVE